MKTPAILALFLLIGSINAAYVNYYDLWSATQQANNILYQKVDAAGTVSNLSWDGTKWTDANQVWFTKDGGTTGRLYPGSTGAAGGLDYPHPLLTWIVNESGTYSINGSQQGGSSTGVAFRKNGIRLNYYPTQGVGSPYNYTFPYSTPGDKLSIEITSDGDSFGDANNLDFRNWILSNEWVFLKVADEGNPTQYLKFNATFSNDTNTTGPFNDQFMIRKFTRELASGTVTITARNSSCQTGNIIPRSIYANLTTGYGGTIYLLCSSSTPIFVQFYTKDLTGNPLDGVLITASKNFNGNYTNVTSTITTAGVGSLWLDTNTNYLITASLAGYTTLQAILQPATNQYTITLSNSSSYDFHTLFEGINYTLNPPYVTPGTNTINFTIYANNSLIGSGLELYDPDGILLNSTTGVNPGNASYNITFNASEYANYTAVAWFTKTNFPRYNITRVYAVNPSAYSTDLSSAIENYKNNPASNTFTGLLAIIITGLIASPIYRRAGPATAGIAALAILGLFTFLNWFNWTAYILLSIGVAAIIYTFRGRG